MATAESFIKRALTKVGIRASESPLTADEVQDGLDLLNDMLSEWENSGVTMGFLPVENASDEVRVPRNAHSAIKANLAVRTAPEYGRVVQQAGLHQQRALPRLGQQGFEQLLTAVHLSVGGSECFPGPTPARRPLASLGAPRFDEDIAPGNFGRVRRGPRDAALFEFEENLYGRQLLLDTTLPKASLVAQDRVAVKARPSEDWVHDAVLGD